MKASLVVFALGVAGTAHAGFYLPGVAPKSYELRENVRVRVWVRVEGLCAVWRHSELGGVKGIKTLGTGLLMISARCQAAAKEHLHLPLALTSLPPQAHIFKRNPNAD